LKIPFKFDFGLTFSDSEQRRQALEKKAESRNMNPETEVMTSMAKGKNEQVCSTVCFNHHLP
jgi:hypothetical protein